MAPKLNPACKICLKKDIGKYRCPSCNIDYCSVVCYKTHKLSGCTTTSSYTPKIIQSNPVISDEADKLTKADSRPKKRLRDLNWPLEPDEGLWGNPLHRDDIKPLRGFEYEAIATSTTLRTLLTSPSLLQTLSRLSSLPQATREPSLRLLLSLPPDPVATVYRPSAGADRFSSSSSINSSQGGFRHARGGRHGQGRGGHGHGGSHRKGEEEEEWKRRGLMESTKEERIGLEGFVEEVMKSLEEARREKGE